MEGWGGGVKWAHCRPQVYQLLRSGVIDTKCGSFTFTFSIGEEELNSSLVGQTSHALNTSVKD